MGENARKQAIKNQQLFTSKDKQFQHIEISEKTNQIYSYICNSSKGTTKEDGIQGSGKPNTSFPSRFKGVQQTTKC